MRLLLPTLWAKVILTLCRREKLILFYLNISCAENKTPRRTVNSVVVVVGDGGATVAAGCGACGVGDGLGTRSPRRLPRDGTRTAPSTAPGTRPARWTGIVVECRRPRRLRRRRRPYSPPRPAVATVRRETWPTTDRVRSGSRCRTVF